MVFLGIDLHKRYSTITAMDKEGKTIKQGNVPNCEHELLSFLASIEEDKKAVVEATTNWSWLCDLLEGGGVEVVLSHPLKTRAIASARIKTDKLDSKTLADLLRGDLVAPAWLAPYEVRQTRDLIRLRACLVKDQTAVKNRIHALLIKNNVDHPFTDLFGKAGIRFLAELELPATHAFALSNWLELLGEIRARIKEVDKRIAEEVAACEEAQLLMTIPGVGKYFGLLIASDIGDISRFPSAKHLCSYAGLIPSTYSSGGKTRYGRITKQGSPWLRWAMVEAAVVAVGRPGPIRQYYLRMKKRKGTNIARVATARKLLANVYHMLKENKSFDEVMAERGFSG